MQKMGKGLLPPDFCDIITVFKKQKNEEFKSSIITGCKFLKLTEDFSGDIRAGTQLSFSARVPNYDEIAPGDILVSGAVIDKAAKGHNGEDILAKYPRAAFRARQVSFCGNHIYVKG